MAKEGCSGARKCWSHAETFTSRRDACRYVIEPSQKSATQVEQELIR